jgi:nitric oxide reductase NorD protein
LLARVSRVLLDPHATDPHPWVVRVRAMVAEPLDTLTPRGLRLLASALGNEVGQMRLPFNTARGHVHAAYRDDNHHLWDEDRSLPPSEQALSTGVAPDTAAGGSPATPQDAGRVRLHPEWDGRIGRFRRDWVRVLERDAPQDAAPAPDPAALWLSRSLLRALQAAGAAGRRRASGRCAWGDEFHPAALVEARVRQRLREPVDDRIYRAAITAPRPARVRT